MGSSAESVGSFGRRELGSGSTKGAAPPTFAFASPRICVGDAKAKAEGAHRICSEKAHNTGLRIRTSQFERLLSRRIPCFSTPKPHTTRFPPTDSADEA